MEAEASSGKVQISHLVCEYSRPPVKRNKILGSAISRPQTVLGRDGWGFYFNITEGHQTRKAAIKTTFLKHVTHMSSFAEHDSSRI